MEIAKRAKQISPSLTLEITAKAKKMKADGMRVVSFAVGEPDFDTPEYIVNAGREALDKGFTKYTPVAGTPALKAAICRKLKDDNALDYEPADIVVSNGAKHSLFNAFMAILNDGDEVIIPSPYWLSYPEIVKMAGGVPVLVQTKAENSFKITPAELAEAITDKTKACILNNPNNPTGAVYTESEIAALSAELEKHEIFVVSDEIYEKLNYVGKHCSIAAYSAKMKERTIVINGLSKSYAMTGWRIGYAAAERSIASAMSSMQSHATSNANSVAQYASTVALSDKAHGDAFLTDIKATFAARRDLMTAGLNKLGLDIIRPDGAFYIMASVSKFIGKQYDGRLITSAFDFASVLLEKALVAVIPCESFGAPQYIRFSYAASESDINCGLAAVGEFLSKLQDK